MIDIEIAGEPVRLLSQRAMYLVRANTLVVADLHWGKEETFRAAAIAIPDGPVRDDLTRLSKALDITGAARLLVLGDMWHARAGKSAALLGALSAWREEHAELAIDLVRGNHDRHAGDPPSVLRIRCVSEPLVELPFAFRHFPDPHADGYVLAGHLHPSVVLHGTRKERLRLSCFWVGPDVAVLPAFGSFTGTAIVRPREVDRVFVIADGHVLHVGEN